MNKPEQDKLITCIIPKGPGVQALEKLKSEFGVLRAQLHLARGTAPSAPKALRGLVEHAEKEIIEVIANAAEADVLFAFLFKELRINEPHTGIMYMQPLARSTAYALPELPDKPVQPE